MTTYRIPRAVWILLLYATTTTTTGTTTPRNFTNITFTATIGSSAVEFNTIRSVYITGVAAALNRVESDVHVVSVVEMGYRRRLLSVSVLVETQVQVPFDEALVLSQSSWVDTMKSGLAGQGITVAAVYIPAVRTVITINPNVNPTTQIVYLIPFTDARHMSIPVMFETTTTTGVAAARSIFTGTTLLIVWVMLLIGICMIFWVRVES
jgi:hypothetical protein